MMNAASSTMPSRLPLFSGDQVREHREVLLNPEDGTIFSHDAGAEFQRRVVPALERCRPDATVVFWLAKMLLECVSVRFLTRRVTGSDPTEDKLHGVRGDRVVWRPAAPEDLAAHLAKQREIRHPHGTRGAARTRHPPLPDADKRRGVYMNFDVLLESAAPDPDGSFVSSARAAVRPLRLAFVNDPHHHGNKRFLEIIRKTADCYHDPKEGDHEFEHDEFQDVVMAAVSTKIKSGNGQVRFLVYNARPNDPRWRVATDFEETLTIAKYLDDVREDPEEFQRSVEAFEAVVETAAAPKPPKHKNGNAAAAKKAAPIVPAHRLTVRPSSKKIPEITPKTNRPSKSSALERSNKLAGESDQRYITDISDYDVIFGRGKPLSRFSGNVRMRDIVEVKKILYAKSHKAAKSQIIKDTMDEIMASPNQNIPVRFLKPIRDGVYELASMQEAHSKISHRLREVPNIVKKVKYQSNKKNKGSGRYDYGAYQNQYPHPPAQPPPLSAAKPRPSKKNKLPAPESGGKFSTLEPDEIHIVFGRELFLKSRIGNIRFHEIVSENAKLYQDAPTHADREAIADRVFRLVSDDGKIHAFHLMQLGKKRTWVKATDESLQERISQLLQDGIKMSASESSSSAVARRASRGLRDFWRDQNEEDASDEMDDDDHADDDGVKMEESSPPEKKMSALASISSHLFNRNSSKKRPKAEPDGCLNGNDEAMRPSSNGADATVTDEKKESPLPTPASKVTINENGKRPLLDP